MHPVRADPQAVSRLSVHCFRPVAAAAVEVTAPAAAAEVAGAADS